MAVNKFGGRERQGQAGRREPMRPRDEFASQQSLMDVAAEVIGKANREHPADAVLRDVLRTHRELFGGDAAEVSRTVFAYYRWFGWLGEEKTVEGKLRQGLELEDWFRRNPAELTGEVLRAKAVPAWALTEVGGDEAWLRSLQGASKLWLRAKRGQGPVLLSKLGRARVQVFPESLVYEGEEDLFRLPEFHGGEFEIQDVSSQAVGWLCGANAGETWWDACAGEGGKTLHLSDLMTNKGLIWASDRAAWRLQKLKRRLARAKVFNYRSALWDGGAKLPTKTKFDGVLVDAPCSGVGTWQRNPHARWTTSPEDVQELAAVQGKLLEHVAGSVKPGGRLIYSVCTLTRSETSGVGDAFTQAHPEFEPMVLAELPVINKSGCTLKSAATVTIWPQDFDGNGMFVAGWRRKN